MNSKEFRKLTRTHVKCSDFHKQSCKSFQLKMTMKAVKTFKKVYSLYFIFSLLSKYSKIRRLFLLD